MSDLSTPDIVDRVAWQRKSVPATSVDALIAGRHFGMRVCYLRDDDRVFETYWTTRRCHPAADHGH